MTATSEISEALTEFSNSGGSYGSGESKPALDPSAVSYYLIRKLSTHRVSSIPLSLHLEVHRSTTRKRRTASLQTGFISPTLLYASQYRHFHRGSTVYAPTPWHQLPHAPFPLVAFNIYAKPTMKSSEKGANSLSASLFMNTNHVPKLWTVSDVVT